MKCICVAFKVLEVVTGIARVNQPAVSLGGVLTGISAVLDRVCVCVGVSVSPSSSSIESQPFEGLDDDGAASHSVGIEASPTYFGSIIESILQCISVLARGNVRGKGGCRAHISVGVARNGACFFPRQSYCCQAR
jgi:hypothetical protein